MNIITFGDSWPEGAELLNPDYDCYGAVLSRNLGATHYNYSVGGSSLEHIFNEMTRFVEKTNPPYYKPDETNIGIFFLTNPARTIYHIDNDWHHGEEHLNLYPSRIKVRLQSQYVYFHDLDMFRANVTVSALQHWCKRLGIIDFYFSGWVKYEFGSMVDTSRIWKEGKETCGDWFGITEHNGEHLTNCKNNEYIKPNFAHPNPKGHKLIADKLEPWILNNL